MDKDELKIAYERIFKLYRSYLPAEPNKIAIKLNLCSFKLPETGAVSHPFVVEGLLEFLKERYPSADLYLVEADTSTADARLLFKYLGFEAMAKRHDAQCVNISEERMIEKRIDGYFLRTIHVPMILEDMDFFISHPKLKSHSLTKISCGLKNQFGCLPMRDRACYHRVIDEVIADVNIAFRPHLTIVDGIIAHNESMPLVGTPVRSETMLASNDIVSVDSACAQILGFDPFSVRHIRKACEKGLGSMEFENCGVEIKHLQREMANSSLDVGLNRWIWHTLLKDLSKAT